MKRYTQILILVAITALLVSVIALLRFHLLARYLYVVPKYTTFFCYLELVELVYLRSPPLLPHFKLCGKIRPPYIVDRLEREEYLRKKAERKADLYFIGGLLGTLAGTVLGWLLAKFF